MSDLRGRVARRIRGFVENPITKLVEGIGLLVIGVSDASTTFREEAPRGHLQVGHGLIILGAFSILSALPHFIEGLDAGRQYLELRDGKTKAEGP